MLGGGPIGLMFVALARQAGCLVTVAGRRAARLAAASRLGAGRVVDVADEPNLHDAVRRHTPDRFDVVILSQTLQVVRKPRLVLQEMLRVAREGIAALRGE